MSSVDSRPSETTSMLKDGEYVAFLESVLATLRVHNATSFRIKLREFELEGAIAPIVEDIVKPLSLTSEREQNPLQMKEEFLKRDKEIFG